LKDTISIGTRTITPNLNVDLDEFGEVIGIEVLQARSSGIDPFAIALEHYPSGSRIEMPSDENMRACRKEIATARERYAQRQRATQTSQETG
jgi:uncharacterized protein YuzE